MTDRQIERLEYILDNNTKWPVIIECDKTLRLDNTVVIPATIPSAQLGIIPGETGLKYPAWLMQVMMLDKKGAKIRILIDGLDTIPIEEQEKFYGIIKYRGVNGMKFPAYSQVIISVSKDGVDKVSNRISSLCIVHKVV
ncbi:MAG: hypothetical protein E7361_04540 [Clostridiales bacterium]|nr:hypothetical protein [Clostridiales bacterium]